MSSRPPDLRAAVVRLLAEAEAILAMIDGETVASPIAAPADNPEWVVLKEAAVRCGVHTETMARRAEEHGLGRRIGRIWKIDMTRVEALQEGRTYEPIPRRTGSLRNDPDEVDGQSEP